MSTQILFLSYRLGRDMLTRTACHESWRRIIPKTPSWID